MPSLYLLESFLLGKNVPYHTSHSYIVTYIELQLQKLTQQLTSSLFPIQCLHLKFALALSLNPPTSWAPRLSAEINAIVPKNETG